MPQHHAHPAAASAPPGVPDDDAVEVTVELVSDASGAAATPVDGDDAPEPVEPDADPVDDDGLADDGSTDADGLRQVAVESVPRDELDQAIEDVDVETIALPAFEAAPPPPVPASATAPADAPRAVVPAAGAKSAEAVLSAPPTSETVSAVEAVARLRQHQARLAQGWTSAPPSLTQLPRPALLAATAGHAPPQDESLLASLEEVVGYRFRKRETLHLALVHSSSSVKPHDDNERLEFLGDAVLDLVVREYCFHRYPNRQEGELTEAKSAVVCRASLARAARRLGIQPYLHIGRDLGKRQKLPDSLVANAYEAVVAALYLDGGYATARRFILETLGRDLDAAVEGVGRVRNPKSLLQQLVQTRWRTTPQYQTLGAHGPGHDRTFEVAVVVGGRELSRGKGVNKKDAEQTAARVAIELINREDEFPDDAPPASPGDAGDPRPSPDKE